MTCADVLDAYGGKSPFGSYARVFELQMIALKLWKYKVLADGLLNPRTNLFALV